MKKIANTSAIIGVLLLFNLSFCNAQDLVIRPYSKIGFLLVPPSLEDLDYDGSGWDQSLNKTNYGLGLQILKSIDQSFFCWRRNWNTKLI